MRSRCWSDEGRQEALAEVPLFGLVVGRTVMVPGSMVLCGSKGTGDRRLHDV